MTLNPFRGTNSFRLQSIIEEELAKAESLLRTKAEEDLTTTELTHLTLTYLEIGDWERVNKFASRVLAARPLENENKALVIYALATGKRERNLCDEAVKDADEAIALTKSDWLISNLLRHKGLSYLKQKQFQSAYQTFQEASTLVEQSADKELMGSFPALVNYSALALGRASLATGGDPRASLALFTQASRLYEVSFAERGLNAVEQRRCHDYISHCVHRGMISCEMSKKHPSDDHRDNLNQALKLLTEALISRKENKADAVRLGDVCFWLGRTYVRLNQPTEAKRAFLEALSHYKTVYADDAEQIKAVNPHLSSLSFARVSVADSVAHLSLSSPNLGNAGAALAQEDPRDLTFG